MLELSYFEEEVDEDEDEDIEIQHPAEVVRQASRKVSGQQQQRWSRGWGGL